MPGYYPAALVLLVDESFANRSGIRRISCQANDGELHGLWQLVLQLLLGEESHEVRADTSVT